MHAMRGHKSGNLLACALALLGAGCVARYVRVAEKGLTCMEAHHVAIDAVRRMGYTITEATKATPGSPGTIIASRAVGTTAQGLLVRVFCTSQGAEVQATTDQGGLVQLSFSTDFQRNFQAAAATKVPPRRATESGVDVLVTPERGAAGNVDVDVSHLGVLPVSVRITNHTTRAYGFRAAGVVLQTIDGERVAPLAVTEIAKQLDADAAAALRQKVVADGTIAPNETLTGVLLFSYKAYVRARVELIDRESNESEGFSIEF
jgi:hypothetical protein